MITGVKRLSCAAWIGIVSNISVINNGTQQVSYWDWMTVQGRPLNSTGYVKWSFDDQQPRIEDRMCIRQSCSPKWIGMINDECEEKYPYICELHFENYFTYFKQA